MRFREPDIKTGTVRYKKRFAFWPKRIGKTTVWFESYYVKQRWDKSYSSDGYGMYEEKPRWFTEKYLLPEDPELSQSSPLAKALK